MKKLMFALAAALPLIAFADTNTVSRAEFDALKREVKDLQDVASALRIFTGEEFFSAQNELRTALLRMKFGSMENELHSAVSEVKERMKRNSELTRTLFSRKLQSRMRPSTERQGTSAEQQKHEVVTREELDAIREELAKVRDDKLERESKEKQRVELGIKKYFEASRLREEREKSQNTNAATNSTTNAPTLLRK